MRVGIVTKQHLSAASETLATLEVWLHDRQVEAVWATDSADLMPPASRRVVPRETIAADVDLVLVLGGDGTLLAVADLIGQAGLDVPILGVNFGSLGFLTEITRPELFTALAAALAGEVAHDERMMLRGRALNGRVARRAQRHRAHPHRAVADDRPRRHRRRPVRDRRALRRPDHRQPHRIHGLQPVRRRTGRCIRRWTPWS